MHVCLTRLDEVEEHVLEVLLHRETGRERDVGC
jgi:hypothetical protein